jgi:glycosyltransferase involved in cell wall biosynthesis
MNSLRYAIVSPMKNEEKFVRKTIEAMIAQTRRPVEWVIVNDGSTDRSAEIVTDYVAANPWIRLLNLEGLGQRLPEHYGGHVVDLIYDGIAHLKSDYDLLVKLDCDVSFNESFFDRLLCEFERNEQLGISSGVSFALQDGELVEEKSAPNHTLGATKVYRRECFADIGGLVPSMGWDGIDEIKARMKGWDARPLRDLVVVHHRPEGLALGLLPSGVERGKGSYFMGYHPLFMTLRALSRFFKPKLAADGMGMLMGYWGSVFRGDPQIPDPEFVRFLRKHQLRKLMFLRAEI